MKPIALNGDMVRAILDGTKTQTRRPVRGIGGANWISIPGTPGRVMRATLTVHGLGAVYFADLEIERAWVERVQEIGEDCAIAEGVDPEMLIGLRGEQIADALDYEAGFAKLWDQIYGSGERGWEANPWVWCCEFKVVHP